MRALKNLSRFGAWGLRWLPAGRAYDVGSAVVGKLSHTATLLSDMLVDVVRAREVMLQQVDVQGLTLCMGDGTVLDGLMIGGGERGEKLSRAKGVILYAGGNCEHVELRMDLLAWHRERQFAVVMVNVRGHGHSASSPSRDDLLTDVDTVLVFLRSLGVHTPIIFGHSIGAALVAGGLSVAPVTPAPLVIADRTFSLLSNVAVLMMLPENLATAGGTVGWVARGAVRSIVRLAGWELEGAGLGEWPKTSPVVVCGVGDDDEIIRPPVQLRPWVGDNCCVLNLEAVNVGGSGHNRGFTWSENKRLFRVVDAWLGGAGLPNTI